MHKPGSFPELRKAVFDYASERMDLDPAPLDGPKSLAELQRLAGQTITESGLGGLEALKLFGDVLAPATISIDHPNYLSFIPAAPTEASSLFDLVVSASSIYGGSWTEGAGAVYAENQVLEFLGSECGLPTGCGGVFVQGLSPSYRSRRCSKAFGSKALGNTCLRGIAFFSQGRCQGHGYRNRQGKRANRIASKT
jgi:hypothetical protein